LIAIEIEGNVQKDAGKIGLDFGDLCFVEGLTGTTCESRKKYEYHQKRKMP